MARVKFLHTSDWQLGMTWRELQGEAQPRYAAARIDSIRTIAALAREQECDFVVVAGDVFEHNLLSSQTVRRSLEAMRDFTCPVYLLPGNHDALDAVSIYRTSLFEESCPPGVHALLGGEAVEVADGVDLVPAPLYGNRPLTDLVADAVRDLRPDGRLRIVVGHGQAETVVPVEGNPAALRLAPMEQALEAGTIHYVALGDRHSRLSVGTSGRIHYSGSPEVTSFREELPGDVLVVQLDEESCEVVPHHVGTWTFDDLAAHVDTPADLDDVEAALAAYPDKARTVVRTTFTGTLSLADKARLDEMISRYADLFAALYPWQRHTDVAVVVDGTELSDLVSGFVAASVDELSASAAAGQTSAADALSLLYRLVGGGAR